MRPIALILLPLLYAIPASAQAQVPLPAERPAAADEATTADEATKAEPTADDDGAEAEAAGKPGRVIRIEIIGEKKPVPAYSMGSDHPARQAELAAQRQRLIEARRRREQQDRARRFGNAAQRSAPFRQRPTNVQ